jgi:hypothetical protein
MTARQSSYPTWQRTSLRVVVSEEGWPGQDGRVPDFRIEREVGSSGWLVKARFSAQWFGPFNTLRAAKEFAEIWGQS